MDDLATFRTEAKRLAELSPDNLRIDTLAILLRLGEQSRHAARELADLNQQFLAAILPGESTDESDVG